MSAARYLGLMSGTSMDGIDAVLLAIEDARLRVQAAHTLHWPTPLQARLRRAAESPDTTGLDELGRLDTEVGQHFAEAALGLMRAERLTADQIRAIGSHGQTLLHRPRGAAPFTLQIGDPNIIAERTGIDVIGDFRRRDIAAGGEGAPLMPAFHVAAFARAGVPRAVVNVGGIGNVTLIRGDGSALGFDCGPGNCLLDAWARRHLNQPFDAAGAWAASGRVHAPLLARLLDEPYLALPPPKSTGRDLFSDPWLEAALTGFAVAPADVQATLLEYTALTIARALGPGLDYVYVCGGGAFNPTLLARLAALLTPTPVATTAAVGIAPEHVEGAGFAWLAHRFLAGEPGNLISVTGARHAVPLGALYRGAVRRNDVPR